MPAEDHPGRHWREKHDAARPSHLAARMMLREAIGFKRNLDLGIEKIGTTRLSSTAPHICMQHRAFHGIRDDLLTSVE